MNKERHSVKKPSTKRWKPRTANTEVPQISLGNKVGNKEIKETPEARGLDLLLNTKEETPSTLTEEYCNWETNCQRFNKKQSISVIGGSNELDDWLCRPM